MTANKLRPKNREVENEMIRPPASPGKPPRSATDPKGEQDDNSAGRSGDAAPPGNIREVKDGS
ncbi:hypothetical protein WBP07_20455 (plasmid) [Novosphingobium sp. BL-8A]|uniref:hypothetical protein n=1 Tax=Novosphingobium sp. BL-8A TaxID=3127639 RepID=UPI0037570E1E